MMSLTKTNKYFSSDQTLDFRLYCKIVHYDLFLFYVVVHVIIVFHFYFFREIFLNCVIKFELKHFSATELYFLVIRTTGNNLTYRQIMYGF